MLVRKVIRVFKGQPGLRVQPARRVLPERG